MTPNVVSTLAKNDKF